MDPGGEVLQVAYQPLLQTLGKGLLTSLRFRYLIPSGFSICKPKIPRFAQQQWAIQLSHFTDVIPRQGDPLELPQVFAAVHPVLSHPAAN